MKTSVNQCALSFEDFSNSFLIKSFEKLAFPFSTEVIQTNVSNAFELSEP